MSLYLTNEEAGAWRQQRREEPAATMHWALLRRADERASSPGLMDREATVDWWHLVVEYLAEAATAYRLKPDEKLGQWIAAVVEDIAQRHEDEWVGPWFRRREHGPPRGYLETAHICIALAAAIDLAPEALGEDLQQRTRAVLGDRGVPLCMRWLEGPEYFNQRCILGAGLASAAVASGDQAAIERATDEFDLCTDMFQPDGSYGETSQYASYAAWGMMVMYESLVRHDPDLADRLSPQRYARCVRWWASNLLYIKPMSGWGSVPRPRMVNFGDCGAIAAPDGDLLLHIAARCKRLMPEESALARWLFDHTHRHTLDTGPFDRASFGFVTRPGFLAPALWDEAANVTPASPSELKMASLQPFSNGDVIARDRWNGLTVLAVRGGGEPFHTLSHNHRDLNSFILAHRRERLLADPGHSCYRGAATQHDRSTDTHSTCTFTSTKEQSTNSLANQIHGAPRRLRDGKLDLPVQRGGRRLLAQREGEVCVIGSECAELYGQPLRRFARFWILAGPHAVFVVDHIVADEPVYTHWHWLLNNRDGELRLKVVGTDRLVARRGEAGMKLFHVSEDLNADSGRMRHGYVHDAYHPRPAQHGEGQPDSGIVVGFHQAEASTETLRVHAIALDSYGCVAGWHLRQEANQIALEAPQADSRWRLSASASRMQLHETVSKANYEITANDEDLWHVASV